MICITCQKVDTEHFVSQTKKDGTLVFFKKCKKCHNFGQYTKRPIGFSKLALDVQDRIRTALADRRTSVTAVALKEGLRVQTLHRWIQKGL